MALVTVVMPVYNSEGFVRASVDSILKQSFADFELLVVDDASTDRTGEILAAIADPRLVYMRNSQNSGQTRSLNRGLAAARGKYIARLDQDDLAAPDRLARQVRLLERRPDVAVVGSWIRTIDGDGRLRGRVCYPLRPNLLRLLLVNLVQKPCFAHPAVMMRASALETVGGYDERYSIAQDYDLWLKLARRFPLRNIPAFLTDYRQHRQSASRLRNEQRRSEVRSIIGDHVAFLLPGADAEDRALITDFLLFAAPGGPPDRLRALTEEFFEAVRSVGPARPNREHQRLLAEARLFYLPRLMQVSRSATMNLWATLPQRTRRTVCSIPFLKMIGRTVRG